ncbi:MAG: hypothetical protein A2506_09610 [Elusimicrobia bacterium RIFOXYD12_FULL_66_9]|nr:MAG: hypothetical protein A2506_09610 [Elusimicrobia bacterium RIFOXYD12_FULL_66_9]
MAAFLLALLLAAPAAAQNMDDVRLDREEWRTIGWNDACSVAFVQLAYPRLGDAIASEPVTTRVGTLTIASGQEKSKLHWSLEADGALSWEPRSVAKAEKDLRKAGYSRAGFRESIRSGPDGAQEGLAETLHSTSTLGARVEEGWPDARWRWAASEFNPLSTCALLVFENQERKSFFRFLLVRVYDTRARIERARAHTTNARLLFDMSEVDAAVAEAQNGARLGPELAIARYHYAAMLALTGHLNQAMKELAVAVGLDPKYKERARTDRDFDGLTSSEDFRRLTK